MVREITHPTGYLVLHHSLLKGQPVFFGALRTPLRRATRSRSRASEFTRFHVEPLEDRRMLAVVDLVINSLGDETAVELQGTGLVTLRSAIEDANAAAAGDEINITFDVSGSGPFEIEPGSPLPAITHDSVAIDGFSQAGASNIVITVDGTNAGASADGLVINSASDGEITGLRVENFSGAGVAIVGTQGEHDEIPLRADLFHAPQLQSGVIDGNGTTGNQIIDNEILDNGAQGVLIAHASQNEVSENVIGGNDVGVEIRGSGDAEVQYFVGATDAETYEEIVISNDATRNRVELNQIGIGLAGEDLSNDGDGILIDGASYNFVGAAGQGNVISFNGGDGVHVTGQATATPLGAGQINTAAAEEFQTGAFDLTTARSIRSILSGYLPDRDDQATSIDLEGGQALVEAVSGVLFSGSVPVANRFGANVTGTDAMANRRVSGSGYLIEFATVLPYTKGKLDQLLLAV